jgi:CSLREA domain-containing protein
MTVPVAASAAGTATVVNLGSFVPHGMNNRQQIDGDVIDAADDDAPPHAALWSAGTLARLPEPGGTEASDANAISANGRIAGTSRQAGGGGIHALTWAGPADPPHQLGPLSSVVTQAGDYSQAEAVDSAGDVVGSTPGAGAYTGFLAAGGTSSLTEVGTAQRGDRTTRAQAITPDGTRILGQISADATDDDGVAGWYLWPSPGGTGTHLDLTPIQSGATLLDGGLSAHYANDLASDGTVLGYKGDDAVSGTFYLRLPSGAETPVTGLIGHNAVNARHDVVGTILFTDPTYGQIPHAALWKPDGTVVDLNALLPANSPYILVDALTINDNGAIAGVAATENAEVGFLLPAGYVVDSTGDEPDKDTTDAACLTTAGTCTLRAAIQQADADAPSSPLSITFNLPAGASTIAPHSALPAITAPVALDARGSAAGKVVIDGASAGSGTPGLRVQGNASTLRRIEVAHFAAAGIEVKATGVTLGGRPDGDSPCAYPCLSSHDNAGPGVALVSGGRDTVLGARLAADATPALDLGGDGRTPNDAKDADSGPNDLLNFPIAVLDDVVDGTHVVSGMVDPSAAGGTIDLYAQSAVDPARAAQPADYVGSVKVPASGSFSFAVPASVPAADHFFSATLTDGLGATSELSPICGDPDGDGKPDSDDDGLCDDWERNGVDSNDDGTVDLPLRAAPFSADPTRKDLYLEVDSMVAKGTRPDYPSAPPASMVKAFAESPVDNGKGIALHVNPGVTDRGADDVDVPNDDDINLIGPADDPNSAQYVRDGLQRVPCDGHLGTAADRASANCWPILAARRMVERYMIYTNSYHDARGSQGLADLGGDLGLVAVGQDEDAAVIMEGGGVNGCLTLQACADEVEDATLMHEFGHLLGLDHGGLDGTNAKPNELSVMNYTLSYEYPVAGRPLDYSRWALAPLDELHLDEAAGVLGARSAAVKADVTSRWTDTAWFRVSNGACSAAVVPLAGAIDWDQAHGIAAPSQAVLHGDYGCYAPSVATLTSYDEWGGVLYDHRELQGTIHRRGSAAAGGATTDAGTESGDVGFTGEDLVAVAAHSDVDGDGRNDLSDACRIVPGTTLGDADHDGYADACAPVLARFAGLPGGGIGGGGGGGGTPAPGGGTPAPAPAATPKLTLSRLSAKPATAKLAHGKVKAKPAVLRFTLSAAAKVTVTAERVATGHRKGAKCLTSVKRGKRCTAYVKVAGTPNANAKAGTGTIAFTGKLGAKHLAKGRYRLTLVARSGARTSAAATVVVTVA